MRAELHVDDKSWHACLPSCDGGVMGVMQDGGDPAVEACPRDIVYSMAADQAANGAGPQQLAQTNLRYPSCAQPMPESCLSESFTVLYTNFD